MSPNRFKLRNLVAAGATFCSIFHSQTLMPAPAQNVAALDPVSNVRLISQEEREKRLNAVADGMIKVLAERQQKLATPNASVTTRDLSNGALLAMVTSGDAKTAERLLRLSFSAQNMDTSSEHYGELPWQINNNDINDQNANEFGTQAIGPLLILYGNQLSEEFKQWLAPHIKASFAALKKHRVQVSYTNIFLMKTVNLMLMGEATGDAVVAASAYDMLEQWITYTQSSGIHEFDSPTYYSTDLGSLQIGYLLAGKADTRRRFKACLNYIWSDIAANCLPSRGKLCGAHSRDYDFLSGGGGIQINLFIEGLRKEQSTKEIDLEKVYALLGQGAKGYHPDAAVLSLSQIPDRIVQQRWDENPSKDRYNYITDYFALGSANGDYGPQDKLIAMDFANATLPDISVVPDITDSPYGKNKSKDKSGHSKPKHLPLHPAMVQDKGVLLSLIDLDPSKLSTANGLATNVLVPSEVTEMLAAGTSVDCSQPFEVIVKPNQVVALRSGDAGVAIRIFTVDGCGGQQPQLVLKADRESLKFHVARLAAYHYVGASPSFEQKHVRIGILFKADKCSSSEKLKHLSEEMAQAQVESSSDPQCWNVAATVGKVRLEVSYDLAHRCSILRRVNNKDVKSPLFSVNGNDVAANIWGPHE